MRVERLRDLVIGMRAIRGFNPMVEYSAIFVLRIGVEQLDEKSWAATYVHRQDFDH